ncbi:MAG TPA: chitobiase/beta-hexosaminidase C-terminal domain-containing protein, partial [Terracidiphilus sp.]|nr:chitobiase/beta-hexosaminidase C-terminal domain-containing protein [Terracidiphilus sp.]
MKPTLLAVLAIAVFAFSARSSAQAFGEAIQMNQQSMQGVGSNYRIGTPGSPSSSGTDARDAARIQFLEVPHPLPDCGCAQPPDILLDPDPNHSGLRLAITSPSKDAAIYYTTDGWTPTQNSQRYTGPFAVSAGAHVQAIAFEAGRTPSGIASANIPAGAHPVPLPRNIEAAGSVLRKGTVLRLVTHADVTSDEAAPGDPLPLLLDESIVDGGTVLVPRGTRVEAKITRVSPAGRNGKSGVISFEVLW